MASNEEKLITIDDTPVNRYKNFIIYGITYFNLMVSTELSMAKSKDNVKANKYLNNAIGESITVTTNMYNFGKVAGTVLAPLMVGVGALANLMLKDIVDDRLKVAQSQKGFYFCSNLPPKQKITILSKVGD